MLNADNIQIQRLKSTWWKNVAVDVLRTDLLHNVVSGNKWFKLKYYLADAKTTGKETIATFGGAYSNHIVATAYACMTAGLKSIGIIRGEKPPQLSTALQDAVDYGMQLKFVSREAYRSKNIIKDQLCGENWYWIDEGGYGLQGMIGAKEILACCDTRGYSHLVCACGTGTTLAGLVAAALPHQLCVGVSVLKGHAGLTTDVTRLLHQHEGPGVFEVFHNYHFGGYAKHPQQLIEWMNELWRVEHLPTDIVYTSKLVFAVKDLIEQRYFTKENKILIIHSGGLQGNRSLPAGTLEFL